MTTQRARVVLLLVLVAVASKLAFLAAPRADLLGVRADGTAFAFHGEEFAAANIALEVRDGPLIPVLDYQWTHTMSGTLVVGLAAVPVFEAFGADLFTLKLVPLAIEVLLVLATYAMIGRMFGPRAATIGGLMCAVSSPGQAALGTIAWGMGASLNLFVTAGLWCYACSLRRDATGRVIGVRVGPRFAFGVVSGLAYWFGPDYRMAFLAVVAFEFLRDRREFLRPSTAAAACGSLVGLAPFLRYNLAHDFASFHAPGGDEQLGVLDAVLAFPRRSVELVTDLIPGSLWHRDVGPVPGDWMGGVAGAALLALVAAGVWRLRGSLARLPAALSGRGPRDLHVGLVLVLYLAAVAIEAMADEFWPAGECESVIAYRYLSILFPGLIGLAAAGADGAWGRAGAPAARRVVPAFVAPALVAMLVVTNAVGVFALVDRSRAGAFRAVDVAKPRGHGRWLAQRFGDDPDRMSEVGAAIVRRRTGERRELTLRGVSSGLSTVLRHQERNGGPYDAAGLRASRERLHAELPAPYAAWFASEAER